MFFLPVPVCYLVTDLTKRERKEERREEEMNVSFAFLTSFVHSGSRWNDSEREHLTLDPSLVSCVAEGEGETINDHTE